MIEAYFEAYKERINVTIHNEKVTIILLSVIIKRNGHVFVDQEIYRLELSVSIANSCAYFRSTFKLLLSSIVASRRRLTTCLLSNKRTCRLECSH